MDCAAFGPGLASPGTSPIAHFRPATRWAWNLGSFHTFLSWPRTRARVEDLALAVLLAPRQGVVGVLAGQVVRHELAAGAQDDVQLVAAVGGVLENVNLVFVGPAGRERLRGGVLGVLDLDDHFLQPRRVALEVRADQVAVGRLAVQGVGGAVRAAERAAGLDPVEQVIQLVFGERVASREEQDAVEVLERLLVDPAAVLRLDRLAGRAAELGGVRLERRDFLLRAVLLLLRFHAGRRVAGEPPAGHVEALVRADLLQHVLGRADGVVDKAAGVRDEQHALLAGRLRAVLGRERRGKCEERDQGEGSPGEGHRGDSKGGLKEPGA